jgi:putative heme iron utilization protein
MGITTGLLEGEFVQVWQEDPTHIVQFVEDHPDLTYEECAEQLNTSEYFIRRCLGLLQ